MVRNAPSLACTLSQANSASAFGQTCQLTCTVLSGPVESQGAFGFGCGGSRADCVRSSQDRSRLAKQVVELCNRLCSQLGPYSQVHIYKKLCGYDSMQLRERLADDRVLLLDGAMGTELARHDPQESDYPGGRQGFNDGLNITHPEWIQSVYASYLDAGSECITTNTFGSSRIKLDEYAMGDDTESLNEAAARLAREAVKKHTADMPGTGSKYVIGSMGPSGYLPGILHPPEETISIDDLEESFYRQVVGLRRGGVDGIILETGQDILELKTMITAVRNCDADLPIIASITLAQSEKMLLGTPVASAYAIVSGMGIDVFGLNCSTGPAEMQEGIRWLDENAEGHRILVAPNAGIPDMSVNGGEFPLQAADMSHALADMLRKYKRIGVLGGCCGTTPEHIRRLRTVIDDAAAATTAA